MLMLPSARPVSLPCAKRLTSGCGKKARYEELQTGEMRLDETRETLGEDRTPRASYRRCSRYATRALASRVPSEASTNSKLRSVCGLSRKPMTLGT